MSNILNPRYLLFSLFNFLRRTDLRDLDSHMFLHTHPAEIVPTFLNLAWLINNRCTERKGVQCISPPRCSCRPCISYIHTSISRPHRQHRPCSVSLLPSIPAASSTP